MYDVVPVIIDPSVNRDLFFRIGAAGRITNIELLRYLHFNADTGFWIILGSRLQVGVARET